MNMSQCVVLLAISASSLLAQQPATRGIEGEIAQNYQKWDRALMNRDADAQDQLLVEEFVGTGRDGDVFTRDTARDGLKSGQDTFSLSQTDDLRVISRQVTQRLLLVAGQAQERRRGNHGAGRIGSPIRGSAVETIGSCSPHMSRKLRAIQRAAEACLAVLMTQRSFLSHCVH
jgi:hypothetical protein